MTALLAAAALSVATLSSTLALTETPHEDLHMDSAPRTETVMLNENEASSTEDLQISIGSAPDSFAVIPLGNAEPSAMTINGIGFNPTLNGKGSMIVHTREFAVAQIAKNELEAAAVPLDLSAIQGGKLVPNDAGRISLSNILKMRDAIWTVFQSKEGTALYDQSGLKDANEATDGSLSDRQKALQLRNCFHDLDKGGALSNPWSSDTMEKCVNQINEFFTLLNDYKQSQDEYAKEIYRLLSQNTAFFNSLLAIGSNDWSLFEGYAQKILDIQSKINKTTNGKNPFWLIGSEARFSDGRYVCNVTISNVWPTPQTVENGYLCPGCSHNPCRCAPPLPPSPLPPSPDPVDKPPAVN